MSKKIKKAIPFFLGIILLVILFRPILRGFIPLPLDAMIGANFPWLDQKWGYVVGVPVKNSSLSDVFSQLYPWQSLAADLIRQGTLPLWNPYSFSGYPLLANWQSAPFYPLRILMVLFGNQIGFTSSIILQVMLSMLFMYLYLLKIKCSRVAAFTGSIIFALGGLMMSFLEYNTIGQVFLWVPLAFYSIEDYEFKKSTLNLVLMSFIVFCILTAGSFQPALFALIVISLYAFLKTKSRLLFFSFLFIGIGLASIQLLPTLEMYSLSIRQLDHNIILYKFGLLPIQNIATLLAPDIFGNPVTNNFRGFLQYQETTGYFSVLSLPFIFYLAISKSKNLNIKFFLVVFLVSLFLAFTNPFSKLVYILKVPLLSTGYASRWLLLTSLSASVLVALGIDRLKQTREIKRFLLYCLLALLVLIGVLIYSLILLDTPQLIQFDFISYTIVEINTSLRNLILPLMLVAIALGSSLFLRKKIFILLICTLIIFDLSRYFIKFTPFSPSSYATPDSSVFRYLENKIGNYRVEKEAGPILPANTWLYPRFQSTSGYDPLLYLPYGSFFRLLKGSIPENSTQLKNDDLPRYLNLEYYESQLLDLAGVKYLLALKHDEIDAYKPSGTKLNYRIPTNKFSPVFNDGTVVVLENKSVFDRVRLYDQYLIVPDQFQAQLETVKTDISNVIILATNPGQNFQKTASDSAVISEYSANQITVMTKTSHTNILLLTDTDYPGWQAKVDGKVAKINKAFGIYRSVVVPAGTHTVVFRYRPFSFYIGIILSLFSLMMIVLLSIITSKRKK